MAYMSSKKRESTILKKTAINSPFKEPHGGYGVTVNTGACGALNQGSIPCSRPRSKNPLMGIFT